MWKTGNPEIATPKHVQTYCPKHNDTSLSREWRINMANKKKLMKSGKACNHTEDLGVLPSATNGKVIGHYRL